MCVEKNEVDSSTLYTPNASRWMKNNIMIQSRSLLVRNFPIIIYNFYVRGRYGPRGIPDIKNLVHSFLIHMSLWYIV